MIQSNQGERIATIRRDNATMTTQNNNVITPIKIGVGKSVHAGKRVKGSIAKYDALCGMKANRNAGIMRMEYAVEEGTPVTCARCLAKIANAPVTARMNAIVAAANAVEVEERESETARAAAIAAAAHAEATAFVTEEITTVRILRLALFGLPNQEMTIAQLRAALFEVEDQDKRIDLLAANLGRVLGIA